jgi:hypothetical protein
MTRIWDSIKPKRNTAFADNVGALRACFSELDIHGEHRRFLVNRMGSSGSTWLVKLLNSHPDVFCYHEGVLAQIYPHQSYASEHVVNFIRWLAADDMKGAYKAVGDVGSSWLGHIQAVPTNLFTTGILLRHPARMLNTRLKVFEMNRSFTKIDPSTLRKIEERWGIKAGDEMDQIFLQDLFHIVNQIGAVDKVDVIIHLERMNDVKYCCNILQQLTGIDYEPSMVDLFSHNPVNRRTASDSLQAVLQQFSSDQRTWYKMILKDELPRCGYALDNDELLKAAGRTPSVGGAQRREPRIAFGGDELRLLKQAVVERDCEIGRLRGEVKALQAIWVAVQNSVGWRLLESLRHVRRRVMPTGTRRATWYQSMIGAFRQPTSTAEQFRGDTQISKKLWPVAIGVLIVGFLAWFIPVLISMANGAPELKAIPD